MRIAFASTNPHKVAEVAALLAPHGFQVEPLALGVEEDGATFADNAEKKARAALAASGLPSLADDSGLEVDALGGAPGVRSARYAGPAQDDGANNAKLLRALAAVPDGQRGARYRCVLAFVERDGSVLRTEGTVEGQIAHAPKGEGGFGYDPLFLLAPGGPTMAELSREEKNRISHRAKAMAALVTVLGNRYGEMW